jgi:hypothetical protein
MTVAQSLLQYVFNLFIGLDQFLNVITCGDPDETVSSRLGRIKRANNGKIPWRRPMAKLTDKLLDVIQPGHSLNAIEPGRGNHGLIDLPVEMPEPKWFRLRNPPPSQDDIPPITIHGAKFSLQAQEHTCRKKNEKRSQTIR